MPSIVLAVAIAVGCSASGFGQVTQAWVRVHAEPRPNGGLLLNRALAVQVDGAGNTYVAGYGLRGEDYVVATIRYDPAGVPQWTNRFPANVAYTNPRVLLTLDPATNVLVTSVSTIAGSNVIRSVKYSRLGEALWQADFFPGSSSFAVPIAQAVDGQGNLCIAGRVTTNSATDFLLVKFSPAGALLWSTTYEHRVLNVPRDDIPVGLGVDSSGHIYVGGVSQYSSSDSAFLLVKYTPAGNQSWVKTYRSVAQAAEVPSAMHVTPAGEVYLTGLSSGLSIYPWITVKFGPAGEVIWSQRHPVAGIPNAAPAAMAVNAAGQFVLVGGSALINGGGFLTAAFDADGSLLWLNHRVEYVSDSRPVAVAVDETLNVFVTGYLRSNSGEEVLTLKFNAAGVELWRQHYDPASANLNSPAALALGPGGSVAVVGQSRNTNVYYLTLRYESTLVAGLPVIVSGPSDQEIPLGSTAQFEVTVASDTPVTYQWRFRDQPFMEETNRTLVLTNVDLFRSGNYSVEIRNAAGGVVSRTAALRVRRPPTVNSWTVPGEARPVGGLAFFRVLPAGDPPFAFQWRKDGIPVAGATNSSLILRELEAEQAGAYSVTVTTPWGTTESPQWNLNVRPRDTLDEWDWRHPVVPENDLVEVAVGNGRFVAVAYEGTVFVSSDAVSWQTVTVSPRQLYGVTFGNGLFVVVGEDAQIFTSSNGLAWAVQTVTRANPQVWSTFVDVAFGQGRFVAVGDGLLASSADGTNWVNSSAGAGYFSGVAYVNGTFLVGAQASALISTNGLDWEVRLGLPFAESAFVYGQGRYLVAAGPHLFQSTNLVDWIAIPGPTPFISDLAFHDGAFYALGPRSLWPVVSTTIWRSLDGTNWTAVFDSGRTYLRGFVFADGLMLAVGENSSVAHSTNGVDWAWNQQVSDTNLRSIAFGNGRYVVVGNQGALWTSEDGFAWTRHAPITSNNLRAVVFGVPRDCQVSLGGPGDCGVLPGRFVAVGDDGAVMRSFDGLNWEQFDVTRTNLYGLTFGGNRFVAVGDNGFIATSSGGSSWERSSSLLSRRLQGITYGAGRYVATGREGTILVSSNANDWTWVASLGGNYLEAVTYAAGFYVAVGTGGAIVVSTNATNWVTINTGRFEELEGITFGQGRFVAVGDRGVVLSSTNALDWLVHDTQGERSWRQAIYHRGAFLIVGNNESIVRSPQLEPLLSHPRLMGDRIQFQLRGEPGKAYQLETANSLGGAWSPLGPINTPTIEPITADFPTDRTNAMRFYRVSAP